jgi:hypothetical protein
MRRMIVVALVFAGGLGNPAGAEEKAFPQPLHDVREAYRVDVCRVWGSDCGQPAADEYCRRQGFERAAGFTIAEDIGASTPTMTLEDGKACDQGYCDGFEVIVCTRPGPGPLGNDPPHLPGVLPGEPPPAQPPPQPPAGPQPAAPPWTAQDVMDSRIDVQAQYALFRLLKGDPAQRIEASHILSAVKAGVLKGIYQEDQQVPAMRAAQLGQWWGQILPEGADGACMTEPSGEPQIIAMRRGSPPDKARYDEALIAAWRQCGIAPEWPVRPYDPAAGPGTPAAAGGDALKCANADDEIALRARCDSQFDFNLRVCDELAAGQTKVRVLGVEVHSYEECAARLVTLRDQCQGTVSEICGA